MKDKVEDQAHKNRFKILEVDEEDDEFEEDFENVVKVGLLDEEPKGEYGLMALWGSLRGDEGK